MIVAIQKQAVLQNRKHQHCKIIITGGQTSFTRPDGIHVIALGHLRP